MSAARKITVHYCSRPDGHTPAECPDKPQDTIYRITFSREPGKRQYPSVTYRGLGTALTLFNGMWGASGLWEITPTGKRAILRDRYPTKYGSHLGITREN